MTPIRATRMVALVLAAAGATSALGACTYVERERPPQQATVIMPQQPAPTVVTQQQPAVLVTPAPTVTVRPNS